MVPWTIGEDWDEDDTAPWDKDEDEIDEDEVLSWEEEDDLAEIED